MAGDSVIFKVENRTEDYYPAYSDYRKNYFLRDRWVKYLTPVFVFLLLAAVWFTLQTPRVKKESGMIWTAVIILFVFIAVRISFMAAHDRSVTKALARLVAKGPYEVTIDSLGIQAKYSTNIEKLYWKTLSQMMLHEQFLSFQNQEYELIFLIPKGNIPTDQWLKAHEFLIGVSDKLFAERNSGKPQ